MAFMTDTFATEGALTTKFKALWANYREDAQKRAAYRATFNELSNLSTRELNDLGISRSSIRRCAYEAVYEV